MSQTAVKLTPVIINSGNFSGESKKGNFSGYSNLGRIFIHKKVMESSGIKTEKDLKFPFFALVEFGKVTEIVGEDGKGTGETLTRDQATAIFADEDAMDKALNFASDFALRGDTKRKREQMKSRIELAREAKDAGLTDETVAELMSQI